MIKTEGKELVRTRIIRRILRRKRNTKKYKNQILNKASN